MHLLGHGIDIVVCRRIEEVWQRHGERFLERIFTLEERTYCLDSRTPVVRLSGRFAAKEAVLKALGTGWRGGILWTDIEVLPDGFGKPHVGLTGGCADVARAAGIELLALSISHAGDYAVASALALGGSRA
ncbi:MAG: Holo-[acyl-carrier-protein] synthase [Phycisphaerae bacterium]|nr:Holo-[acyl-carrier-protein] synthase [Phycisphaerae bacterium]